LAKRPDRYVGTRFVQLARVLSRIFAEYFWWSGSVEILEVRTLAGGVLRQR